MLYEDARGPANQFGLHKLVLACMADATKRSRRALHETVNGRPMKGAQKLLDSCKNDLESLRRGGAVVVAVFDADRIRSVLGPAGGAEGDEVVGRILDVCGRPEGLHVYLLERNLESVLRAIGKCDGELDAGLLDRALKKSTFDRDRVLNRAASSRGPRVLECVLREVPSLERIVRGIGELLPTAS